MKHVEPTSRRIYYADAQAWPVIERKRKEWNEEVASTMPMRRHGQSPIFPQAYLSKRCRIYCADAQAWPGTRTASATHAWYARRIYYANAQAWPAV